MENTEQTWRPGREYFGALLAVTAATGIGYLIRPWSDYWAVAVIYLFTIVLLGLRLRQGPILFAATLCALTWDFLFFPPLYTFVVTRVEDWLMLGFFFVIALVTGRLTGRIRAQEQAERARAQRATALYQLTRVLASAQSADEVLRNAAGQVADLFGARLAVLTAEPAQPDRLVLHPSAALALTEAERHAAREVFRGGVRSSRFAAPPVTGGRAYFLLAVASEARGVMVVQPAPGEELSPAQTELLDAFATQVALALEHERLRAEQEAARVQAASDRLHRTLLDSVSHELKTPLAVITSATESLGGTVAPAEQPLVQEIHVAAERLRGVVVNLLDTTRLESGGLQAQHDWCDVSDLVNAALKLVGDTQSGRPIHLRLPAGLPLIRCDFDLIQQALANLVHNACRHTPPEAEITITAGTDESAGRLWLAVADNGPGLREEQRARLFERFFRGEPGRAGGLGLGLSIARGFAEAHGGTLTAENQAGGGARFVLSLPLQHHDQVPVE